MDDLDLGASSSRDFVAWMKTVPKSPYKGSGFNQLIRNINPSVPQEVSDAYVVDISEAAKSFPKFCNSGDEDKDI